MGEMMYKFGFAGDIPEEQITKAHLGGKGYGLARMCQNGIPVPPGLIIPTHFSQTYMASQNKDDWLTTVVEDVWEHLKDLKNHMGYMPLLSVRSGAPVSMPGMMDTILNVGITSHNIGDWAVRFGDNTKGDWVARDCQRRLMQMLGSTAFGVPHDTFEAVLHNLKDELGVKEDKAIPNTGMDTLVERYRKVFQAAAQQEFPDTLEMQLYHAVKAVFDSWSNPRAIAYRKMNNIPDDMGTAIVIQSMVFGNMGEDSGTGVLFSRCPMSGEQKILGEFLPNAQGEDVVAGIRTPIPFDKMTSMEKPHDKLWANVHAELVELCHTLEHTIYSDMVDIEFTVQQGKLYVLQSRVGKRSALSAFVIARDLVHAGGITVDEAFKRLTREQFKILSRPMIPAQFKDEPHAVGIPASPGVAKGKVVFTADAAVAAAQNNEKVILFSKETTPDDIAGMNAAEGILTLTGGATSHAAVVARAMDKPCVVGCAEIKIASIGVYTCGSQKIVDGSTVTIDGATGRVWVDVDVPVVDASSHSAISTFLDWAAGEGTIPVVDRPPEEADHGFAIEAAGLIRSGTFELDTIRIASALQNGHKVLMDCTGREAAHGEQDGNLMACFGVPEIFGEREAALFNVLGSIKDGAKKNLVLMNVSEKTYAHIAQYGFIVVGPAKNLNDYMENPYATMDDKFVNEILGSPDMVKLVEKLAAEYKKKKVDVPKMIQRRNALFNRLSA